MELFLRAVSVRWSAGAPRMLRVPLDGLDDQVELIGAVNLIRIIVFRRRQAAILNGTGSI